jgi:hypothetical protein
MVSIKYTPSDMNEYQRLKNYLDSTGQSTNGFIKKLINDFFESGQDKNNAQNIPKDPVQEKRRIKEEYYPCSWIDAESIQFFYDRFGQKAMDEVIKEYLDIVNFDVEDILEGKGCGFDEWVSDIKDRINDNEFQGYTNEEILKILIHEMYGAF